MSASLPVVAGRYQLLHQLPGGNFAETVVARDIQTEQTVVVKLLREAYTRDPSFVRRFGREARLARAVDHPNVVTVVDTGWDGAQLYLVLEWVDGQDLKQLIIDVAPLAINQAVGIILDVLAGLDAIHAAGIIHRDIKPQNILLDRGGHAKIADFGIARAASDTGVTHTGQAVGTAAYMAPEQASGGQVSAASDLYAVGVVLFELVTGRLPFTGTNAVRVMYQHVNEPPPRPRVMNRRIPIRLEQVILRALAKDPNERFATVAAFRTALLRPAQEPTIIGRSRPRHDPDGITAVGQTATTWPAPVGLMSGGHAGLARTNTIAQPSPRGEHSHPGWLLVVLVLLAGITLATASTSQYVDIDGDGVRQRVAALTEHVDRSVTTEVPPATAITLAASTPTTAPDVTVTPIPSPTSTTMPSPGQATLATAAPRTATSRAIPMATPTLTIPPSAAAFQVEFIVPSDRVEGVTVEIPITSRYAVQVVGGAYSPWPDGSRQWRTLVYGYAGRAISWRDCRGYGHVEPCDPDIQMGLWEDDDNRPNQPTAEAAGRGLAPAIVNLQAGTVLQFVAIDEQSAYTYPGSNVGTVTLRISTAP